MNMGGEGSSKQMLALGDSQHIHMGREENETARNESGANVAPGESQHLKIRTKQTTIKVQEQLEHSHFLTRGDCASQISSELSSPPDSPLKPKSVAELAVNYDNNTRMAHIHRDDLLKLPEKIPKLPAYDEYARPLQHEPTAGVYSDVRSRKRSRSLTPEDDYPVPQVDDMSIPPERNIYKRRLSGRFTDQTPSQHTSKYYPNIQRDTKKEFEKRRAERKVRDEREWYDGLQNSPLSRK
jgi:hypothetical protein